MHVGEGISYKAMCLGYHVTLQGGCAVLLKTFQVLNGIKIHLSCQHNQRLAAGMLCAQCETLK